MAEFVTAGWRRGVGASYVNVDRAARLESVPGERNAFRALSLDGEELGIVESPFTQTRIVPNLHTGVSIAEFWLDGAEFAVINYPILAWRITAHESFTNATPITYEDLTDPWAIRLPAGFDECSYVFPDECSCRTLDEARSYARERITAAATARAANTQKATGQ